MQPIDIEVKLMLYGVVHVQMEKCMYMYKHVPSTDLSMTKTILSSQLVKTLPTHVYEKWSPVWTEYIID